MLHVSGATLFKENIPNSQLEIIQNCNHALFMDQPDHTANCIRNFLFKIISKFLFKTFKESSYI